MRMAVTLRVRGEIDIPDSLVGDDPDTWADPKGIESYIEEHSTIVTEDALEVTVEDWDGPA